MGKFNGIVETLESLRQLGLGSALSTTCATTSHPIDGPSVISQQQLESFLFTEELAEPVALVEQNQAMAIDEEDEDDEDTDYDSSINSGKKTQDHVMATDSYGKLRFCSPIS